MTGPVGNTGGSNVGTAYGKVRIDYESSGVAKATKEVTSLQRTVVEAGQSFDRTGSQIDKATAQVGKFAAQASKSQAKVGNPAAGLGAGVERESARATKALAQVQAKFRGGAIIAAPITIRPSKVEIDRGAITRAVATFQRQGLSQGINLTAPVNIMPGTVNINRGAISNALRNIAVQPVTVRVPINVDPQVTVNQGSLQNQIRSQSSGSVNTTSGVGVGGGGGGGGNAGLLGAVGLLARVAPIAGAAAAAVGSVGLVFTKGFDRLQGLDAAAIKLKALGYQTSQIKGISDVAVKSVDGLAFDLDEAFQTSADALNAGIPLQQLSKYLGATANTAALAGVGMQDLGQSLSQVAVTGKLSGDVMSLLVSRNVPILKLLGDEYGVTQQKAQEMVTNGEVDFNHLINALSKTEGAGKAMGNTVSGSFKNLGASISRIGAMLLAPLFGAANGEASTFAKAIQWVTMELKGVEGWLKNNKDTIVDVWVTAGQAVLGFGQYTITVFGWILEGVGKLVEGIGTVGGVISDVLDFVGLDDSARALQDVSNQAKDMGKTIFGAGQKVFSFRGTITDLQNGLEQMGEKAKSAGGEVGNLGADSAVQMDTLSTALEKLGVKSDDVLKKLQGSTAEFKDLMKTLKAKGASEELLGQLTKLRGAWDNGGRAAKAYSDALSNMADKTLKASDRADALIDSMKQLGLLPGGDALAEYNKQFNEMTSYTSTLADQLDTLGGALVNVDGTINSNSNNGQKLVETLNSITKAGATLALSGDVTPDAAFASTTQELQQVLSQFGIVGDQADSVIKKYLQPIQAQFNGSTPEEVLKNTLGNDPAKLDTVLDLLTTSDMIVAEITGGPGQSIKIPATIDITNPDALNPNGMPAPPPPPLPPPPGPDPNAKDANGFRTTKGNLPDVWVKTAQGEIKKVNPNQIPPGATTLDYDPTKANIDGGGFKTDPKVDPQGTGYDLGGNQIKRTVPVPLSFNSEFQKVLNESNTVPTLLGQNPDLGAALNPVIDGAQKSGQSVADAFAEGINSGSPEVKAAIIKLAMLVGDGLGNSPAKYGPLSGKGYSLFRGQKLTNAFATGIESQSGAVKDATSAVASAASDGMDSGGVAPGSGQSLNWDEKLTRTIADIQQLSDFGKSILDFGKQLGDIAFSGLKTFNDLSGGRLFPKNYITDPDKKPAGSSLGGSGLSLNGAGAGGVLKNGAGQGGGANFGSGSAPGTLGANPSKQQIADYIINKAKSEGYNDQQAQQFLTQAVGESGLDPKISGGVQGVDEVVGIFQEMTAFSGGLSVADRKDAQKNIDAYFANAATKGGPQAFTDPAQFLGKDVSGGGPYHPENQAKGHLTQAEKTAQQYISGYGGPSAATPATPPVSPTQTATPATGLQLSDLGAAGFQDRKTKEFYREIGGKYYKSTDLNLDAKGTPQLDPTGLPLLNVSATPPQATNVAATQPNSNPIVPSSAEYGLPKGTDTGGYGSGGQGVFPDWVLALGKSFGVTPSTYAGHQESDRGEKGYASNPQDLNRGIDWVGSPQAMEQFAQYLTGIAPGTPGLEQVIYQAGKGGAKYGVGGAGNVDPGYYPADTYAQHGGGDSNKHVHTRQSTSLPLPGTVPLAFQGDSATGTAGTTTDLLSQIAGNTSQMPYLPQQLSDFASGNPDLQGALGFSSGSQADAIKSLQSLDSGIADANKAGNKGVADALGSKKSQLQSSFGLKEDGNGLDKAQGVFNGAAGAASDVFAAFDAGLKYIGALKDTGDVLVRGISNTADINRLIDNFQIGLDFAAKITQAASSITGLAAGADPSGIGGGISSILGVVSQVISAVNTGIDIAQEAYKIAGKYVGRALTSFLGFPGATDVNFLLDEVTGQVKAYTSDNPEQKTTLNTLGREFGSSRYSERPPVTNYNTVYQGPGQDPRDTMNDMMFSVRSSGVGAFGYDG